MSPGRWQLAQWAKTIGAMSRANVGTAGDSTPCGSAAAPAAPVISAAANAMAKRMSRMFDCSLDLQPLHSASLPFADTT